MKILLATLALVATISLSAQTPSENCIGCKPEVSELYLTDSKEDRVAVAILRALVIPEYANGTLQVIWAQPAIDANGKTYIRLDLTKLYRAARGAAFVGQKNGTVAKRTWLDLKYMDLGTFQSIVKKMNDPENHDTIFTEPHSVDGKDYIFWRATQRGRDALRLTEPEKNFQDYVLGRMRYSQSTNAGPIRVFNPAFDILRYFPDGDHRLYVGYLLEHLRLQGLITVDDRFVDEAWTVKDDRYLRLTRAGMAHVLRGNIGNHSWGGFDYLGNWDSKWVNKNVAYVGEIAKWLYLNNAFHNFSNASHIVGQMVADGTLTLAQQSPAFIQMGFLQSAGLLYRAPNGFWELTDNGRKFGKAVSEGKASY